MPKPIQTTFDLLARSANTHAVDVLIDALDFPDNRIRCEAVAALLKHKSIRGHTEIIQRFEDLTTEQLQIVEREFSGMAKAVRQVLLNGEKPLQARALEMVRRFEGFEQFPALLSLLEDDVLPHRAQILETIHELADALYAHLNFGKQPGNTAKRYLRDAERVRQQTLTNLENACDRMESPGYVEVVEAVLVLGEVESGAVKKVLGQAHRHLRTIANRILLESTHPGVLELVIGFMSLSYPNSIAFRVIEKRSDPEFVCSLLRNFPRLPSPQQLRNFKQIETVTWLEPRQPAIDAIPPGLHVKLASFLEAVSISRENKIRVIEWLVSKGSPEARQMATSMLDEFDSRKMQTVILDGLDSEDSEVQAWATSQLRSRRVPEAFALLIQKLDSPMSEVQSAAREELEDFSLARFLNLFEHLEPQTGVLAGRLIRKINPGLLQELMQEMANPIRRKRIRAAKAAVAMNVEEDVLEAILDMLEDTDAQVRRTAVEILGRVPTPKAQHELTVMLEDSNPRIRDAAAESLRQIEALRREIATGHSSHSDQQMVNFRSQ